MERSRKFVQHSLTPRTAHQPSHTFGGGLHQSAAPARAEGERLGRTATQNLMAQSQADAWAPSTGKGLRGGLHAKCKAWTHRVRLQHGMVQAICPGPRTKGPEQLTATAAAAAAARRIVARRGGLQACRERQARGGTCGK